MRVAISLRQSLLALMLAGGTVVAGALPAEAAEGALSSFNFVNRATLGSSDSADSTGNPLRSGGSGMSAARAGSMRVQQEQLPSEDALPSADDEMPMDDGVVPASYNDGQRRLQLRSRSAPTSGFLSGVFGENKPAPRPVAMKKPQSAPDRPQFASPQLTRTQVASPQLTNRQPSPASTRSQGLVPQFVTSAEKRLPNRPTPNAPARDVAKRQVAQTSAAVPPGGGRPVMTSPNQAVYRSASSAAAYQPAGMPAGAIAGARRPATSTGPTPARAQTAPPAQSQRELVASNARPIAATAKPVKNTAPTLAEVEPTSSAAAALIRAHKLTAGAKTESDFTQVFLACQQVPANPATETETAFSQELSAWALNRRGQLRASAGKTDQALADFDAATRLNPAQWRAFHNRGVLEAQAGQFEPAFDDFRHTIELNPKYAKAYSNRAALFVVAGQLELALRDYEKAVHLDPSLAVAQRGCGRTCHMMGRLDEGLDHLNLAVRCAPRDAAALVSRGDVLSDLGHFAEASDDYEQALAADPRSVEACRSSAWLLATCPDDAVRNPELALERAQMASRLERKEDAATFDTLAAAQANVGDFGSAVASIRKAIELAPASEKSVYQDRLQMYRRSTPYRAEPIGAVQQAQYQQQ